MRKVLKTLITILLVLLIVFCIFKTVNTSSSKYITGYSDGEASTSVAEPEINLISVNNHNSTTDSYYSTTITHVSKLVEDIYENEFKVTNYDDDENVTEVAVVYKLKISMTPTDQPVYFNLYWLHDNGEEQEINLINNNETEKYFMFYCDKEYEENFKIKVQYDGSGSSGSFTQNTYTDSGDDLTVTVTAEAISVDIHDLNKYDIQEEIYNTSTYTASIGTTYYDTLQDAIDSVEDDGMIAHINLLKNIDECVTVYENTKIVINLNNYIWTNTNSSSLYNITNNGDLTLRHGTIKSEVSGGYGILNNNILKLYSNLKLKDTTVTGSGTTTYDYTVSD